jgi:hypothetical protein
MATYVGDRKNRRHRPGRAFERTDYRFELVTDYGAFRDLQRHRMLTIEWQPLTADLGYDVPEVIREAGLAERFEESLRRSADFYNDMRSQFPEQSQYVVALAFRIRYSIQMNAREAMHLIELRSGPQGHPSYRRVAHEMARLIREEAGHGQLPTPCSTWIFPTPIWNGSKPSAQPREIAVITDNWRIYPFIRLKRRNSAQKVLHCQRYLEGNL